MTSWLLENADLEELADVVCSNVSKIGLYEGFPGSSVKMQILGPHCSTYSASISKEAVWKSVFTASVPQDIYEQASQEILWYPIVAFHR